MSLVPNSKSAEPGGWSQQMEVGLVRDIAIAQEPQVRWAP
jgi:hypothetical protein